jgi:hypothetical protein
MIVRNEYAYHKELLIALDDMGVRPPGRLRHNPGLTILAGHEAASGKATCEASVSP